MKLAATTAGICVLGLATMVADAQDNRSLTNSGLQTPPVLIPPPRNPPASVGTPAPRADLPTEDDEDAPVEERVLLLQNSIKQLTQSLANANAEAETYKRQAADATLRLQTLGIAGVEGDESKLEQKLLAAVRDLRLARKSNEELRGGLIQLSEAVMAMLKTSESVDADTRGSLETELRRAAELLGSPVGATEAAPVEATLSDAVVAEVREDLSLVVANVGDKHGVKIGMPFQVWRDNKRVGEVRVIDVRDRISGAVVQSLENPRNPVQAGDRLRVDARQ